MRSNRTPIPILVLGAALALWGVASAGPAWAEEPRLSRQQDAVRLIDAATLVGAEARSNDGRTVGALQFLMIDPRTADIAQVLIRRTGVYDDFVAVPWRATAIEHAHGKPRLSVGMSKRSIDQASSFTVGSVARLTAPVESTQAVPGPGSQAVAAVANPSLIRDNELKGRAIYAGGQNESGWLGEIKRLMIDPAHGKVAFVVVATGRYLGMGEDDIAVPLQALEWTASGRYVLAQNQVRDIKKSESRDGAASSFGHMSQQRMTTLYRTFGVEPYWKG